MKPVLFILMAALFNLERSASEVQTKYVLNKSE